MLFAQTGGENAYPFIDLPYNARTTALGRKLITVYDDDINAGIQNPASFNSKMSNSFGVNQALMAGGLLHGMVAYAHDINNIGTGAVHLRYATYGKMKRTDETGAELGTFSAGDFALGASLGRSLNKNLSIGATFNLIWSQLESYSSMGLSLDFAGMYRSTNERTLVSAIVKNIGVQLFNYTDSKRTSLPIDAMIGVSHELKYAPFRFSVVMHHLNRWDLTYFDPSIKAKNDPLTGELIPLEKAGFGEKLGRHFIFQVEAMIGKVIIIRGAFNYNRRRQLLVENRPGMGGFSFGAGLNFKRFTVDYGLYIFSSAGFNNMISLRTNIDSWRK